MKRTLCFLFSTWSCVITACTFVSHKAREHLYHSPNDAVWSWFAPHRPAGKNITSSCGHWGQHVSGGNNTSQTWLFFVLCLSDYAVTHEHTMHELTDSYLSQCCRALFVGDRNVPVLRHRHVPCDTPSPGCIHRQHGGGPVFAQRPGTIKSLLSRSLTHVL